MGKIPTCAQICGDTTLELPQRTSRHCRGPKNWRDQQSIRIHFYGGIPSRLRNKRTLVGRPSKPLLVKWVANYTELRRHSLSRQILAVLFTKNRKRGGSHISSNSCISNDETVEAATQATLLNLTRSSSVYRAKRVISNVMIFISLSIRHLYTSRRDAILRKILALKVAAPTHELTGRELPEATRCLIRDHQSHADVATPSKTPIYIAPKTTLARLIIVEAHDQYHRGVSHTMATNKTFLDFPFEYIGKRNDVTYHTPEKAQGLATQREVERVLKSSIKLTEDFWKILSTQ
ncbi:unnamed protein product [Heligmosomoides polygyrus]|uniref:Uncharacterized protein n=1 Tax=Heligmosomoides polygyrus TaxID=6339 RepID=A0A183G955_HELPZ|nr:unnamed protein product [Heligmosomoides polygyrus]